MAETEATAEGRRMPSPPAGEIEVGLLTGGADRPYALGLATALISSGVCLDVIGSDDLDSPELHAPPAVTFLNLRGSQRGDTGLARKVARVLVYYARLVRYAAVARPKLFHILWNNKVQTIDRTLLMLYYKLLGKTVVLTAHNVNAGTRDANDSRLNRLTLKVQYTLADHIFVHTQRMKSELVEGFGVRSDAVTVIPFGINNAVPNTDLTPAEAKRRLGLDPGARTILFFGWIWPYKGLEFLVAAFQRIAAEHPDYRLIIAGKLKGGNERYLDDIRAAIARDASRERVIQRIEYIPDAETEVYFKAADVCVLPYKQIFQSGVLFLGYSFGLPVIAADVGSLREDIVEGRTGSLCVPCDPGDLARALRSYFDSDLYKQLDCRRQDIRDYATERHSWDTVSDMTCAVYEQLLARDRARYAHA
jgi:glycosyltransferase involved in cell wall biosynthesis